VLTLNYGFRYDVYTPFTEVHNHISNFDLTTGQILIAGQNGVPTPPEFRRLFHFSPRVGFAPPWARHGGARRLRSYILRWKLHLERSAQESAVYFVLCAGLRSAIAAPLIQRMASLSVEALHKQRSAVTLQPDYRPLGPARALRPGFFAFSRTSNRVCRTVHLFVKSNLAKTCSQLDTWEIWGIICR